MKIEYTKKLFFKRFVYKLTLEVKGYTRVWHHAPGEVYEVKNWIDDNITDTDLKFVKRWQRWDDNLAVYHGCVYCKDPSILNQLLAQFGSMVLELCQPLDHEHQDNLEVRNIIEVRKDLIYKKYQYAVYFKYDRKNEILPWLQSYFENNDTVRVSGNTWWPKLYLCDNNEIMAVRLTWQERIDYIKTVRCLDPLEP